MELTARRVVIVGRVQGVYFRAQTVDVARAAGVAGWVANRPDGAVEAHLEGPTGAVAQVIAWMHEGPSRAHVTSVTDHLVPVKGMTDFVVRPTPA